MDGDFTWLGVAIVVGSMVSLVVLPAGDRGGLDGRTRSRRRCPAMAGGSPEADGLAGPVALHASCAVAIARAGRRRHDRVRDPPRPAARPRVGRRRGAALSEPATVAEIVALVAESRATALPRREAGPDDPAGRAAARALLVAGRMSLANGAPARCPRAPLPRTRRRTSYWTVVESARARACTEWSSPTRARVAAALADALRSCTTGVVHDVRRLPGVASTCRRRDGQDGLALPPPEFVGLTMGIFDVPGLLQGLPRVGRRDAQAIREVRARQWPRRAAGSDALLDFGCGLRARRCATGATCRTRGCTAATSTRT